jgi:LPS export ABC transporter permease LptG/LPS export ABC transporter permease LptF
VRRVDRYILREILYPTLIGLSALTFIVVSRDLGRLMEFILRQSASANEIWAIVAAILPNVLIYTLPMAVLVGILTGFGRLSSDSETIALRAAGISMNRILAPVLALGIVAWLGSTAITAWIAPETAARLQSLKGEIALRQAPLVVKSGIFNEKAIDGVTLYLKSVTYNPTEWRNILLDDMRTKDEEAILFAESGTPVLNEADNTIQVTLKNGNLYKTSYLKSQPFDSEAFISKTISIPLSPDPDDIQTPGNAETSTRTLWQRMQNHEASYQERVEFHRRFALPFACIVFVLVGLPLGVSTTRGSKSMGLVFSLVLMFLYYLAFFGGTRLASDSNFSPFLGAWIPNLIFLAMGIVLISRADRLNENFILLWIRSVREWLGEKTEGIKKTHQRLTRWAYSLTHRSKLIRVMDRYVIRTFIFYFLLVLIAFVSLFIIVTVFELVNQIVRNHISISTVVLYFIYLTPQMLIWVVPLTTLLAILISLGTLTKSNEVLAIKAAGVSLYRLSTPLLFMGLLLSGGLYLIQEFVLPAANQRQDEYRNFIRKGIQQSFQYPDRKWMAGSDNRIYHYNHFDYSKNLFANLSIFKFDPETFKLREWTFASSANWEGNTWMLQNATVHRLAQSEIGPTNNFLPHMAASDMDPPDYFKDEVRTASQMTYGELERYVEELRKKQFDVTGLTLDLYRKISFPLIAFIMALIGVPFSFKTGKKGAFYGIGICIGFGILYWSTFELFNKLGEVNRLSPLMAAWFPNLIFGIGGTWMMLRVKS